MNETKANTAVQGSQKITLDPEKLGMMNKINWQKYVKPEDTAFVIVDLENWALSPDGALSGRGTLGVWEAIGALENNLKLVKAARKHNMKVYWIRFGFFGLGRDIQPDSPFGEWLDMFQSGHPCGMDKGELPCGQAFERGGWGWEIIDEAKAVMEPQDIVINKTTMNGFVGTTLQQMLTAAGIKNIILSGIVTDNCVTGTARSAKDMGYYPMVVADATATHSLDEHYRELYWLSGMTATAVMTDEIIGVLDDNSVK